MRLLGMLLPLQHSERKSWARRCPLWSNPVRVIAFNVAEGWCRDVTVEIADEVSRRYVATDDLSETVLAFLEANRR